MRKLFSVISSCLLLILTMQDCLAASSNILIFVSFSMPKTSIKGWINEGQKIETPIIIRGLVHNSFKETIQKLNELAQDHHGGLQLDPTLFQRYNIQKVPALVVTNNSKCLPNQTCKEDYDVVYGDVTLSYALNKIANQNDNVSEIARDALLKLRNNHDE